MTNYVSYLRVSTQRQGQSGLGIEAQRQAVHSYLQSVNGTLLHEFIEVESGSLRQRPILAHSIAQSKRLGAVLLIAKLDRLARNVAFVSSLMDGGVDFVAADAPYANRLMLHILAAFAEHEREQISERTKAALAAAKQRGVVLGANGRKLADSHLADARIFAETMREPISALLARGARTLQDIADGLNRAGNHSRGGANWSPGPISRVLKRLDLRVGIRQTERGNH
jgi:DNA invertase Pin-like site-specific DNA recombinase